MNIVSDPRIAPAWTIALAVLAIGTGIAMSRTRLQTVAFERSNTDIAQSRVSSCRVVAGGNSVILGGYYFQPTEQAGSKLTGDLLPEGTYICDGFGGSARIERGGFAQYVVVGDATEMNKVIGDRLKDPANPDSNPLLRPRLDLGRPIYQAQPAPKPQDQFFNLK